MKQSKKILLLLVIFSYFFSHSLIAGGNIAENYNEGLKSYLLKDYETAMVFFEKAFLDDPYFKKTAELYRNSLEFYGEQLYRNNSYSASENIFLKLQAVFPSAKYRSMINLLSIINNENYSLLKINEIPHNQKKHVMKYMKYETESNRKRLQDIMSRGETEKEIVADYLYRFHSPRLKNTGLLESLGYLFLTATMVVFAGVLFQISRKVKFAIMAIELYEQGKKHIPHINIRSINPRRFMQWHPDFEKFMTHTRTYKIGMTVDRLTGRQSHNIEVGNLAFHIAEKLNLPDLNPDDVQKIGYIHDAGYITLVREFKLRGKSLNSAEFREVQKHVSLGLKFFRRRNLPELYRNGLLYHHERYDGTGYPKGLKGEEIPIIARIISVADFIITLTSYSESRHPVSIVTALSMLDNLSGKHFDPVLVDLVKSIYLV